MLLWFVYIRSDVMCDVHANCERRILFLIAVSRITIGVGREWSSASSNRMYRIHEPLRRLYKFPPIVLHSSIATFLPSFLRHTVTHTHRPNKGSRFCSRYITSQWNASHHRHSTDQSNALIKHNNINNNNTIITTTTTTTCLDHFIHPTRYPERISKPSIMSAVTFGSKGWRDWGSGHWPDSLSIPSRASDNIDSNCGNYQKPCWIVTWPSYRYSWGVPWVPSSWVSPRGRIKSIFCIRSLPLPPKRKKPRRRTKQYPHTCRWKNYPYCSSSNSNKMTTVPSIGPKWNGIAYIVVPHWPNEWKYRGIDPTTCPPRHHQQQRQQRRPKWTDACWVITKSHYKPHQHRHDK